MSDALRRLRRRIEAVREAVARGEPADAGQLRDLVSDIGHGIASLSQAPAVDRRELLLLLDEAGTLRDVLERELASVRRAIDAGQRRRRGEAAYRRPPPG